MGCLGKQVFVVRRATTSLKTTAREARKNMAECNERGWGDRRVYLNLFRL